MSEASAFSGSVPAHYDTLLGPVIFEPFAMAAAKFFTVRPGMRALEIAAGSGRLTKHLLERMPADGRLIATDLNEDMLKIAASKIDDPRVEFKPADGLALPFEDRSFDAVVCQFGVMFYPDKAQGLKEALRVLKPQRRFLYSVWGSPEMNRQAEVTQALLNEKFPDDPPTFLNTPYGHYSEKDNRNWMADAGFSNIHFEPVKMFIDSDSAHSFARGLVLGTPMAAGLLERGATDLESIAKELGDRLAAEFGDHPMRLENTAYFVSGDRPHND